MAPQITIQLFLASCLSGFCPSALNSHLIQLTSLQDYFEGDNLEGKFKETTICAELLGFAVGEIFILVMKAGGFRCFEKG